MAREVRLAVKQGGEFLPHLGWQNDFRVDRGRGEGPQLRQRSMMYGVANCNLEITFLRIARKRLQALRRLAGEPVSHFLRGAVDAPVILVFDDPDEWIAGGQLLPA